MNYIGSKKTLLPFLEASITKLAGSKKFTFLDLFAGTGIVGLHFKKLGHTVIANDLQYYSYVLNQNYVGNNTELAFAKLPLPGLASTPNALKPTFVCNHLTNLPGHQGFIYHNYCLGGTQNKPHQRQFFSDENSKKADAIRTQIAQWQQAELLTKEEYYFLLATLVENIDSVANTASVYGAFLKKLKKTAQKPLVMKPALYPLIGTGHKVFNQDVEALIKKVSGDVLYLDPPYNHRQYAPNYHLLETIARYDNPAITGKTGLRNYENQKSKFCQKNQALPAFRSIIEQAKVKYICVSYNNEGILTPQQIKETLSIRGKYHLFTKQYGRFKADSSNNRAHKANAVVEYLHCVTCD